MRGLLCLVALMGTIVCISTIKIYSQHKTVPKRLVYTQRIQPIPIPIRPITPAPVQPIAPPKPREPETLTTPDIRHLQGLYNDPKSHATRDLGDPHECTHQINSQVRNQLMSQRGGNWNACYVLRGKTFPIQEPPFALQAVAQQVPANQRGRYTWQLYMQKQVGSWNSHPCYILDEWSCYLNGIECDLAAGRHDQASYWMQCAQEFNGYAQTLLQMAKNSQGYDATQLEAIVRYQEQRMNKLASTKVIVTEYRSLLGFRMVAQTTMWNLDELYPYLCVIQPRGVPCFVQY